VGQVLDVDDYWGEEVMLIRTTFDGEIVHEWMPVTLAIETLMDDENNGTLYYSGRIYGMGLVDFGLWDRTP